jgi:tRNA uracil 4-sulfurtransferase
MEKAVALLSGGIDSPVAIHRMKDNFEIIAVHCDQRELTGNGEIEKVEKLAKKLGVKKLYCLQFTNVFKEIADKCNHRDYFILSKIAMFKAAEEIAKKENSQLLITGENLAQVSSQTLSNMKSIDSQIKLKILRPLLTWDKQDIINLAEEIGTYEISKGPEICSLLGPNNPRTKSTIEKIERELARIDLNKLIKEVI